MVDKKRKNYYIGSAASKSKDSKRINNSDKPIGKINSYYDETNEKIKVKVKVKVRVQRLVNFGQGRKNPTQGMKTPHQKWLFGE